LAVFFFFGSFLPPVFLFLAISPLLMCLQLAHERDQISFFLVVQLQTGEPD
jgi:hypothetical protein